MKKCSCFDKSHQICTTEAVLLYLTNIDYLRLLAAILLSILLFTLTWEKLAVVLSYEINKAYIVQVLCENKDKPSLGCEGKCVLSKQLQRAADPVVPPLTFDEKPGQQLVQWLTTDSFNPPEQPTTHQHTLVAEWHDYEMDRGIFHPPK